MTHQAAAERELLRHVVRTVKHALRAQTVEQHYSAESLAKLLGVSVRTVWTYIELGESTKGKEGIFPVVKLSHKVVRIPASSARRMLEARTIATSEGEPQ